MRTIIVIVLVCLVSGLLVYPWLTRSLNRAKHISRIKRPGFGGNASGHFGGMDDGSGGRANSSGSGKGEHP